MSNFQPPIGTEAERSSGKVWPGTWVDATPYGTFYFGKWFHTGADLNNNSPRHDADAHAEIYSIGDGVVTYSQLYSKQHWGNLVIIDHGIVDGKPLFSRYAHVEDLQVSKGDTVKMGQFIARVGNQFGVFAYHLHFDISTTMQLLKQPYYWPGGDKQGVKTHFIDPKAWLQSHHVVNSPAVNTSGDTTPPINKPDNRTPANPIWYVITPNGIDVFDNSLTTAKKSGKLTHASKLILNQNGRKGEGFIWAQIAEGNFKGKWIQMNKVGGENYLSTNKPTSTNTDAPTPPVNVPDNRNEAKAFWHVTAQNGLDVFDNSLTTSNKSGTLTRGSKIMLNESGRKGEGFIWVQIAQGEFKDKWIQKSKADQSESYISTNPPQH